ncbi:MAG: hypothetical protein A3C93_02580 [Candidatus Lloydbacteria bacterium RIFCSPHIGHO2_02_FULL_54_17]|uniref:N-methyl-D-aspartate receptor NMDAR2C subunit n=1 Tax=Candidatus Lloydbacteria bacterium RIFCSPHIGHO2_02_FULL_54_17 TaxID=1798664 RepID=A0A1G2DDT3_9BACT|nr:MAG: hypothetical protein A2762_04320 [Candidatus Lloydbacteria bacterium RIFCSPHIGHO2_01_FULL_54_11]OGZ11795.1 MAG: hypothetical protein A3C93_02580 [Candidatus Lloydbacteria bacterium RIFCSPHIGHO2_02_FULL_54_17]OGZ14324.1 MAG: hypothetical protein A2948_01915 [Candidatus Lloydbacteria bacterium RIFCSPLOWO2_01_FULL_54_18]OGZ16008.1 MAG: hypothetical protein A3H76_00565 [Candidatus Lloydbacteria bacterium RIFCSPLOWO2_02_FULL_54_12]
MSQVVKTHWLKLCEHLGAWSPIAESIYEDILDQYTQPHRRYHTMEHIEAVLREFDDARHLAKDPDLMEFALVMHDAIYNPRRDDNEERSAEFADIASHRLWIGGSFSSVTAFSARSGKMILASKHLTATDDPDTMLFLDLDLVILGKSRETFDRYDRQIRQEYWFVPDAVYRKKRKQVMASFLKRPSIYLTDHFKQKYEERARENIERIM